MGIQLEADSTSGYQSSVIDSDSQTLDEIISLSHTSNMNQQMIAESLALLPVN